MQKELKTLINKDVHRYFPDKIGIKQKILIKVLPELRFLQAFRKYQRGGGILDLLTV